MGEVTKRLVTSPKGEVTKWAKQKLGSVFAAW